jgi:argininosuccinate lyase
MSKLWGGRFVEKSDEFFLRFNQSLGFDCELLDAEIRASIAYGSELAKVGILTDAEFDSIRSSLLAIVENRDVAESELKTAIESGVEDIHSFVEMMLVRKLGTLGYKLHTGRSRNEQVATDLRIYMKDRVSEVALAVGNLQQALIEQARAEQDAILPGYTHLQRAQPILWPHYLLSWVECLDRDNARLADAYKRIDVMPLGSGALSGNAMGFDRERLKNALGFATMSNNSLDATSDRDFVLETSFCLSTIMLHLSRMAEDLIIYSSKEYGFVRMSDKVATGSSLMPQKRNPDALELIRGKTGRVVGNLTGLMMTIKGLPSAYNKDMQEDKEGVFDSLKQTTDCLKVMTTVVESLKINKEAMEAACSDGYLNATDLADYFVYKGVPFRKAHEMVGQIVTNAEQQNKRLEQLSMEEFKKYFDESDEEIYDYLNIRKALARKNVHGGTAPQRVRGMLITASPS